MMTTRGRADPGTRAREGVLGVGEEGTLAPGVAHEHLLGLEAVAERLLEGLHARVDVPGRGVVARRVVGVLRRRRARRGGFARDRLDPTPPAEQEPARGLRVRARHDLRDGVCRHDHGGALDAPCLHADPARDFGHLEAGAFDPEVEGPPMSRVAVELQDVPRRSPCDLEGAALDDRAGRERPTLLVAPIGAEEPGRGQRGAHHVPAPQQRPLVSLPVGQPRGARPLQLPGGRSVVHEAGAELPVLGREEADHQRRRLLVQEQAPRLLLPAPQVVVLQVAPHLGDEVNPSVGAEDHPHVTLRPVRDPGPHEPPGPARHGVERLAADDRLLLAARGDEARLEHALLVGQAIDAEGRGLLALRLFPDDEQAVLDLPPPAGVARVLAVGGGDPELHRAVRLEGEEPGPRRRLHFPRADEPARPLGLLPRHGGGRHEQGQQQHPRAEGGSVHGPASLPNRTEPGKPRAESVTSGGSGRRGRGSVLPGHPLDREVHPAPRRDEERERRRVAVGEAEDRHLARRRGGRGVEHVPDLPAERGPRPLPARREVAALGRDLALRREVGARGAALARDRVAAGAALLLDERLRAREEAASRSSSPRRGGTRCSAAPSARRPSGRSASRARCRAAAPRSRPPGRGRPPRWSRGRRPRGTACSRTSRWDGPR